MTPADVQAQLRAERARWEARLAAVPPDALERPGLAGTYSVRDLLLHLDAYHRALVTWLAAARAGRVYVDPVVDQPDLNARNAAVLAAAAEVPAATVVARYWQTLNELEAAVAEWSDAELTEPDRTARWVVARWPTARPLWQCILNDSLEHQQQHGPDLDRGLAGLARERPAEEETEHVHSHQPV